MARDIGDIPVTIFAASEPILKRELKRAFRAVDGARRLVTVDEGACPPARDLAGAIVRVRLLAEGERDDPEFAAWLGDARAIAERVVLVPAQASKPLPDAAREAAPRAEDARKIVVAMATEANVEDRDALLRVVGEIMDAENL